VGAVVAVEGAVAVVVAVVVAARLSVVGEGGATVAPNGSSLPHAIIARKLGISSLTVLSVLLLAVTPKLTLRSDFRPNFVDALRSSLC